MAHQMLVVFAVREGGRMTECSIICMYGVGGGGRTYQRSKPMGLLWPDAVIYKFPWPYNLDGSASIDYISVASVLMTSD